MKKGTYIPNLEHDSYAGEWIIVYDNEIIGHNKDVTKLGRLIDSCKRTPSVIKIPKSDILLF